jgi:hypothetical protein
VAGCLIANIGRRAASAGNSIYCHLQYLCQIIRPQWSDTSSKPFITICSIGTKIHCGTGIQLIEFPTQIKKYPWQSVNINQPITREKYRDKSGFIQTGSKGLAGG